MKKKANRKSTSQKTTTVQQPPLRPEAEENKPRIPEELLQLIPKHISFPLMQHSTELFSEFIMFLYASLSALCQMTLIHGRTVFWDPEFNNESLLMNFWRMEIDIGYLIFIVSARRFFFCLSDWMLEFLCPKSFLATMRLHMKYSYVVAVAIMVTILLVRLSQRYALWMILVLVYPIFLHLMVFRLDLDAFLKSNCTKGARQLNGQPVHSCSLFNAEEVRQEINFLTEDCNFRLRQVIFTAFVTGLYSTIVPLIFRDKYLYYERLFSAQVALFGFLGALSLCIVQLFPARYADVMHRASVHLGSWEKCQFPPPETAVPWDETKIWPSKSYVVSEENIVYRSKHYSNCAIPGNRTHEKFFALFKDPTHLFLVVSTLHSVLVIVQLIVLYNCSKWHDVAASFTLLCFNFYPMFKLVRDFLIARQIYLAEVNAESRLLSNGVKKNE